MKIGVSPDERYTDSWTALHYAGELREVVIKEERVLRFE